jgi:hypothetical protein
LTINKAYILRVNKRRGGRRQHGKINHQKKAQQTNNYPTITLPHLRLHSGLEPLLHRTIMAEKHKANTTANKQNASKTRQHRVNGNSSTRGTNTGKLNQATLFLNDTIILQYRTQCVLYYFAF